jgi:FdhD protein
VIRQHEPSVIQRGEAGGAVGRPVLRIRGVASREGPPGAVMDAVAVEEPLEIRVDGETVATTMRTPGRDPDLALGFLFAEGIIGAAAEVGSMVSSGLPGNVIDVTSAGGRKIDVQRVLAGRRWATTTSACGVCGRRTIDDLLARVPLLPPGAVISSSQVVDAMRRLTSSQPIFARTGGLHAAGILDEEGRLESAEDVGRHNAVDKAVGALLRRGLVGRGVPGPSLLVVSGRTSFEIVQKATAAGIPCVAGVSAPSSLAIDLAQAAGVLLIGFVRGDGFNVYASAHRLAQPDSAAASSTE